MPGNDLGTIAPMPGDELPTLGQPSPDSMAIEPADDPVIDPPEDAVEEPVFDLPDAEAPVEDDEPDGLSSIAFGHGLAVGLVATPRVELEAITYEDLLKQIAASDAKLTLVDGWASWCAPCKENFPHVTAMAKAYSDAGPRRDRDVLRRRDRGPRPGQEPDRRGRGVPQGARPGGGSDLSPGPSSVRHVRDLQDRHDPGRLPL